MRKDFKILFCLLFLYSLVRIPIILSNSDASLDEFQMGVVALEILKGLPLPFLDYEYNSYALGFLFASVCLVPWMAAFGSSLFVIKLAPFFVHLLSLTVWFFVFKTHFSLRKTFLILLFFIFTPPQVLTYMLQNNGHHFLTILWMGIALLMYQRFLEGKFSEGRAGFCLGLLGAFTTVLVQTNFIIVAVLWIYTLLIRRPAFRRGYFLSFYFIWFLIGFSPWLLYNYSIDWKGVGVLAGQFPLINMIPRFWENLFQFLFVPGRGLQGLFGFHSLSHTIGYPLTAIYVGCYVLGLAALIWRNRGFWKSLGGSFRLEVFALIFSMILPLLVALKDGGMFYYYYLFPLVPFAGMFLATITQRLFFQRGLVIFCLGACLVGDLFMVRFDKMGETIKRQGYSYRLWFIDFEQPFVELGEFTLFHDKTRIFLGGRREFFRRMVYQTMTEGSFKMGDKGDLEEKLQFIEREPEISLRFILLERLGMQIGERSDFESEKLKAWLPSIKKEYWPAIYRGAVAGMHLIDEDIQKKLEMGVLLCLSAPNEAKGGCYEGLGLVGDKEEAGGVFRRYDWMATQVEEKYRPNFLKGVGEHVALDAEVTKKFLAILDGEKRQWFIEGLEEELLKIEDPFERDKIK